MALIFASEKRIACCNAGISQAVFAPKSVDVPSFPLAEVAKTKEIAFSGRMGNNRAHNSGSKKIGAPASVFFS
jgi:hypothetical protein